MNIQIYALKKNFDVQKAERYFKERRIKYQLIDMAKKAMSPRELDSVCAAVGLKNVVDAQSKLFAESTVRFMTGADSIKAELLRDPRLIKTPIVRNGKQATVGYQPEIWDTWE